MVWGSPLSACCRKSTARWGRRKPADARALQVERASSIRNARRLCNLAYLGPALRLHLSRDMETAPLPLEASVESPDGRSSARERVRWKAMMTDPQGRAFPIEVCDISA